MDNFVLAQPEQTDHQCQSDQLIVSGGSPIPAICGVNSGSHSKHPIYFFRLRVHAAGSLMSL